MGPLGHVDHKDVTNNVEDEHAGPRRTPLGPPALVEDVINQGVVLNVVVKTVFDLGHQCEASCCTQMSH